MNLRHVLLGAVFAACASSAAMAQMPPTYTDSNGIPHAVVPTYGINGGGGGVGGAVTVADGADQTLGSKGDNAFTGGASGTAIAILKGIYNGVTSTNSQSVTQSGSWAESLLLAGNAADTNAGASTANTLRAAANLYLNGVTPDTNVGAPTATTIRTASEVTFNTTAASTGHGTTDAGTMRVELPTDGTGKVGLNAGANNIGYTQTSTGFTESTAALSANQVAPLNTHALGSSSTAYCYFGALAYADQPGTLFIDQSLDAGSTYQVVATQALSAAGSVYLSIRLTGIQTANTIYRARFVNGGTANTVFRLSSGFTAN